MSTQRINHDVQHCIWMDAGVAGYKLCDRNLQCDQCPFDETMRRPSRSSTPQAGTQSLSGSTEKMAMASDTERVASLIGSLAPMDFPDDRLYHSGHLWVKPLMESVVAVGIDHFSASLLGSLASVVLPSRQSRIIHRMPWCWLIHHEGAISLYSPVNAEVVTTNDRLLDHPELLVHDPYGDGWIVHAQIGKAAIEGPTLFASREFKVRTQRDLTHVEALVMHTLKKTPSIGQTLYDGGQPAETLAGMLGSKSFFKITAALFTP